MISSGPLLGTSVQNTAEVLLRQGKPFVAFPNFSIQDIQDEKDQDGAQLPFSEWLTKRLQVGQPFVISGFDRLDTWPPQSSAGFQDGTCPNFGIERLIELSTKQNLHVHNCSTGRDLSFTLRKFADSARQSFPEFQGLYARDLQCPQEWLERCRKILPTEVQWGGRLDLFQWLPACARSEVMMAYVGSEGSNSGFHRCFSSTVALNLLVDAEDDRPVVSIGTDYESQEKYDTFMSARGASPHVDWVNLGPDELIKADFPLYVCDQKVGDLVVFPPATAHQIWNPSKLSTKLVWNILHPLSLEVGIQHVQPIFNRICHPDVARSNLSLACAMLSLMKDQNSPSTSPSTDTSLPLPPDLPLLSRLFRQLVHDESIEIAPPASSISLISLGKDVIATCNFCNTAIWNRHVRCTVCLDFDLCLLCYLNGRSCSHAESYVWAELVLPEQCTKVLNRAREILGFHFEEPLLAQQTKTLGSAANDLMRAKSSASARLCHLCRIDHPEWKGRRCDECSAFFCYRGLFRHFDMNPIDVMRHRGMWTCPKCLEICNCRCCHFTNAYMKTEKPTSKRRVKASDPRGKIMGFADNVFDQKRGNRRDGSASISSSQIAGKKRMLEPERTETTSQGYGKLELPTPESESAATRFLREGSEFMTTSSNADTGFYSTLPGVRTITEGSNYLMNQSQERLTRPSPMLRGFGTIVPSYNRSMMSGTMTPLPPIVPREEHESPMADSKNAMGNSLVRTTSNFVNVVTTTQQGSPDATPSHSLPSPTCSATLLASVLDKHISKLEAKIDTLRKYDEEFAALKLGDSRKMLLHQLKELESELDARRKEKGISLIDRLKREGFDGLAEIVGREVGIDEIDSRAKG